MYITDLPFLLERQGSRSHGLMKFLIYSDSVNMLKTGLNILTVQQTPGWVFHSMDRHMVIFRLST